jgi:hypothetical protein
MRKVIRPDAEEERASVLRLAEISSDLTQEMLRPLRIKQENDTVLLQNASAFSDMANIIRKDTGEDIRKKQGTGKSKSFRPSSSRRPGP